MHHRVFVTGVVLCVCLLPIQAQQAPPPGPQVGLKWSEEQLRKAATHVQAGRRLTPKSWPNGARVAVCLSFDPDNFSTNLNRGDTSPVGISAGEYAPLIGLPRLLKLLDAYDIPASFYVPAVSIILHPEMVRDIAKSGRGRHEIAMHGWIHENPEDLNDPVEEWRLISQAMDTLQKYSGKRPTGNRNPSWTMSAYTMELLEKAGLLYDSSLQAMDEPHDVLIDGRSTGIIELPVNWILDDAPMLGATSSLPSPRLIMQTFKDDFDLAYKEGTLFMLTMHPHLTPQRSRIKYLEELIQYMKSKPGVWFATGEEIAKYIKQQRDAAR